MAALLSNDKLDWKDDWLPRDEMIREVDVIREYAERAGSPLVLCHGDLHSGNIVWNKETGEVAFIKIIFCFSPSL